MSGPPILRLRAASAVTLALSLLAADPCRAQSAGGDPEPLRQQVQLGAVRVTLEADRRTMPIDGRLHLSLAVEAPAGTEVTLPAITDRLGPFVVASEIAPAAPGAGSDRGRWRRDYVLEAEDAGALAVPPLTIAFRDPSDGQARALATEPVRITVTSLLPADVDLTAYRDIAPPVELAPAGRSWLVWPLALLALGLAGLALHLWRRRRRSRVAIPAPEPAHLLALAALARLERRLPADRPGTEEFYVRLADILRQYVARRFALSAPTRTTEELLAAADRADGPLAARSQLIGRVLACCDLVKFARHQPAPAAARGSLRHARDFVEQTADPQANAAGSPSMHPPG